MTVFNSLKKVLTLLAAALIVNSVTTSPLYAANQASGGSNSNSNNANYLRNIMVNTFGTLQAINQLPTYFNNLGQFIESIMTPDNSQSTSQIQANFATLGNLFANSQTAQNGIQLPLTANLFNLPLLLFITPPSKPDILKVIPNLNDLTYSTMYGSPPAPKAPNVSQATYNYVKNASGITLTHTIPGLNWQGSEADQLTYQNYYNTVMSIASFDGYVLSNLYADSQNKNALTTTQNQLITQASSSSWVAQIATEELGKVFRQILMFESQNYVLISELVKLQKQALVAQAMNNALLILANQNNEVLLVSKAQGVKPQP